MCAAVYSKRHLVKATEVTAGLTESSGSRVYDSRHLQADCLYTRISSGPQRSVTSMGKLLLFTLLTVDYRFMHLDNNYLHVTEVYRIFALRARLR